MKKTLQYALSALMIFGFAIAFLDIFFSSFGGGGLSKLSILSLCVSSLLLLFMLYWFYAKKDKKETPLATFSNVIIYFSVVILFVAFIVYVCTKIVFGGWFPQVFNWISR